MYTIAKNAHGLFAIPDESNYTFTSQTVLSGQVHEAVTIEYITKNCGDGDIVHAGAGFGDFLPALSAACKGLVFSFEPNTVNFHACMKTIALNELKNVIVYDCGIGSISSRLDLKIKEAGLSLGVRSEITNEATDFTEEVRIETLDKMLLSRPRIDVIHLDIEGYEFEALEGAKKIIERDKPIIILEIDGRALDYNRYMKLLGYQPVEQLIYNAGPMVFVNTVYKSA